MKTYIVGNWKLNFNIGESSIYLHKIQKKVPAIRNVEIVVAPSTLALQPLSLQIDRKKLKLAAQNAYHRDFGAYTGEVSFNQLRGLVDYCIIGHPERRYIIGEDDKTIARKVEAAIRNKITPILCVGETESERAFNETADIIRDQVLGGLSEISEEDLDKVIITYEPIWAISTTKSSKLATPDEVAEVVKLIRETLEETYGKKVAESLPILYGGNVRPTNVGAYLTLPGVNGIMVGAASLILDEFNDIIEVAKKVRS